MGTVIHIASMKQYLVISAIFAAFASVQAAPKMKMKLKCKKLSETNQHTIQDCEQVYDSQNPAKVATTVASTTAGWSTAGGQKTTSWATTAGQKTVSQASSGQTTGTTKASSPTASPTAPVTTTQSSEDETQPKQSKSPPKEAKSPPKKTKCPENALLCGGLLDLRMLLKSIVVHLAKSFTVPTIVERPQ